MTYYNDDDIDQANYEQQARDIEALKAKEICVHGWVQGANDKNGLEPGQIKCLEDGCDEIFISEVDWQDARYEAMNA